MPAYLRIRELRGARGLTQQQLAARTGVPQPTISRLETGYTRTVDLDLLERIARALEVTVSDLVTQTAEAGAPAKMGVKRAARRIKFIRCALEYTADNRCRAEVYLEGEGGRAYAGTAEREEAGTQPLLCAAHAAVEALHEALGLSGGDLALRQAEIVEVCGTHAVLVSLSARYETQAQELLGLCEVRGEPARAAALAVLNGSNRFFGTG